MRLVGVLLLALGVSIIWLLGLRGLTVEQAIADVQQTLHLGQPTPPGPTNTPTAGHD